MGPVRTPPGEQRRSVTVRAVGSGHQLGLVFHHDSGGEEEIYGSQGRPLSVISKRFFFNGATG